MPFIAYQSRVTVRGRNKSAYCRPTFLFYEEGERFSMEEFKKVVCNCNKGECPYGKEHCCLGEINVRSLNGDVPLKEKHRCKAKHSKEIIGVLAG